MRDTCGDTDVCDFETNQCGYTRDDTGFAKWFRNYGPSWLRSTMGTTGPATDHTEGAETGFYMVMLNIPNLYVYDPGDKARIVSQCYPGSRTVDVSFYYHMYGDGIGQLNVFLVDCSLASSLGLSVISLSGDQGDEWKLAGFSQANVGEFRVLFEAVRGPTNNSDIAIDDITVERTETNAVTNPQDYLDEASVVCTFEIDPCGYVQDKTDDTDMIYNHGTSWLRQVDGSTGPTSDHTNGIETNFYMILMNVPGLIDLQPEDKARLISPCYTISSWVRIQFFYHMYGVGMGTLNVYSSNCEQFSEKRILISISGNQGDEWREGSRTAHAEGGVQFTFEAVRGSDYTSDIAIDDIALYALNEEDITTTTEKVTTIRIVTTDEAPLEPTQTIPEVPEVETTMVEPTTQQKVTTSEVIEATEEVTTTEAQVDPCDPNPCQNGGECSVDSSNSYACVCMTQWTGDNCESEAQTGLSATTEEDSSGLTAINIVAIVIACITVIVLLGCFLIFGYRGRNNTQDTKQRKLQSQPSYERARQLQEQLQGRQMHLPKTKQTYQQKQQLLEEEKRRQREEQQRHEEAERLRRERLRELHLERERQLQEQLEKEEDEDPELYTIKNQISTDSIEEDDPTRVRPPLRKQQSSGRRLPKLPNNQNFV
ncbi:uncharacterized protein [Antedon mediterranea]|uniref:uncharacterized protein isoform X2 n=1 Tax=Antedon mediterranea TaxID=105859 RepID=UPI003AF87714